MFARRRFLVCVLALAACKGNEKHDEPKIRSAAVTPSANPTPPPNTMAVQGDPSKPKKPVDAEKGDKKDEEWIPAENKSGAARWKDTGVYLDGKCIGFLSWGELPLTLKPVWVKDRVSATKRPGTKDLGWRWAQQRRYRIVDYITAMGIDLKKVKVVHMYGPRFSNSIEATQADLQTPLAKEWQFRFGSNTSGKAIPFVPEGFGRGHPPDKLAALMIYVDKKPPEYGEDGFTLDGVPQEGVPYLGEPLRGGIRVYLDNHYATMIKRQELDPKKAAKGSNGELEWKFAEFLAAQGVDTSKAVEMWVIRDETRAEKFPIADVANMTFQASAQAKGGVLLGEKHIRANAIAFHSKAVTPEELPIVTVDDD